MSEETRQALETIRQERPNLCLSTIQNIYERGILEYLTQFAVKAQELRQSIRKNAIDQLGFQGLTPDRIDRESMNSIKGAVRAS